VNQAGSECYRKPDREGGPHSQVLVLKKPRFGLSDSNRRRDAALPPDVRKGFAFPLAIVSILHSCREAPPRCSGRGGASPEFKINDAGKAKPFRTSGGKPQAG
jgi:hypothetical protein